MMFRYKSPFLISFALCSGYLNAAPITWIATSSNDLNTASNWSPSTVPGTADTAVFDSTVPNVSTDPTDSSAPFSISTLNFPHLASPFTFAFNNQTLSFSGAGITGAQTNATLNFTNTDNGSVLGDLVSFTSGGTSTMGSADITCSNSASITGAVSGQAVGIITSHLHSAGAFTISDGGTITASNTGFDDTNSSGGNFVGVCETAQVKFDSSLASGNDTSITITNTGNNTSHTTSIPDQIAYLNDNQLFVGEALQAGNGFHLSVSNAGNDSSTGIGPALVAVINSNSGTTGDQVLLLQGAALGSNAAILISNAGNHSGTNTAPGSQVAGMNQGQFTVGNSGSIGSHNFTAGNLFSLSVSNAGNDSATGIGGDAVGTVSTNQVAFFTPCSLGNQASISISNAGNYTGSASTSYVNVGSVGSRQFIASSTFVAGNEFNLHISNAGNLAGGGIGGFFIGDLITGQQADFEHGLTIGNNASISLSNAGLNSSSTTNQSQVGSMMGQGAQLLVKEGFQAGDNLQLSISNAGLDNSSGSGGHYVGFINDNTASSSACQLLLVNGGSVGNNASITLSNEGTSEGSNTGSNMIATLGGSQFTSTTAFQAGDQFGLSVSSSGTNNASNQSNNSIASLAASGSYQVNFGNDCTVGNGASFVISNSGTNHDASGTDNLIGYVTNAQMHVAGNFSAGTDLNIQLTNSATNAGNSSNLVGYIGQSQLSFGQVCTLHDGSTIAATNSGTVGASQILFSQGFDIPSGKATIQVANTGVVTNHGIEAQGSNAGGNAAIELSNSSLYVATTLPTFTIESLQGDATSTVQSQPTLIINKDLSSTTNFAGAIQNFLPGPVTTVLKKAGPGTQILSGTNTYTGLTTVEAGTLVVNGSLAGDTLVDPAGTLKGIGTIHGILTNTGTVAPGNSIGTLTVGTYINNGGTYEVEVNGAGQSDLIHSTGTATLNGGIVEVSSADGTFNFNTRYTIVTADTSLTGTFSGAISTAFITPILSYDPNHAYLGIRSALSLIGVRRNQIGVARTLDALTDLTPAQSLLISTLVNLPLKEAQKGLEKLSGLQYTNEAWITEIAANRFLRRLYDPLRSQVASCCQSSCEEWTAWLEAGPNFSAVHGKTAYSTHLNSYQVTGGVQKQAANNFFLGVAGSYEYDHAKFEYDSVANRNTAYVGLYGLYRPNCFYGLFDLAYGNTSSRLTREIKIADLHYKTSGLSIINTLAFYTEWGADIGLGGLLLQPFVGIQIEQNWRSKITEKSASDFGLHINEQRWTPVNSRLGFHLSSCNLCQCFDVSLDAAWDQRLTSNRNTTKGHFQEFGNTYGIYGNKLDDASIDYALTLTKNFREAFQVYLEFEGQWSRHSNTNGVLIGVGYSW